MKDILESERVGKLIRAKRGRCYYNAFCVVENLPEYFYADYVEGIAICGNLHIEHGWVEKDGMIIDPTLPHDKMVYFAGLRFHGCPGIAKALRIPVPKGSKEGLPFFYRLGFGGIDSPEFRAAGIAA